MEGTKEVVENVKHPVKVGCRCVYARDLLQVCGIGGSSLWVLNVVSDPPHGPDNGRIPAQGGPSADWVNNRKGYLTADGSNPPPLGGRDALHRYVGS